jgi:hypothetical protein
MMRGLPLLVVIYSIVQELEQRVRVGRVHDAYQVVDDREPVAQVVDVEFPAAVLALHLQRAVLLVFSPDYQYPTFYKYQIIYPV